MTRQTTRREFLAATGTAAVCGTSPAEPARPPNVVFIFADDLGYGDLGCYGGEMETPNLDRLAAEGVRFTQAYVASPVCSPSRVGVMTGQFPARHSFYSFLDTRKRQSDLGMANFLGPAVPTLPRAFQSAGYATAHVGKWHMGGGRDVGEAPHPKAYGFDESLTSFEGLGDRILPPGRLSDMSEKLGQGTITRIEKRDMTRIYVDRALDFVRRNRERPFYLHLWPDDVHDPYDPRPELMRKYERFAGNPYVQQYYAVLDEMDRQIGRFLAGLQENNVAGNTLVVFASDNGPTAWARYYKEGHEAPGRTGGLRGRKWSLYEGGIRVPLIARWPGRIPAGAANDSTVLSTVDLFPSFCSLAGLPRPKADFDGEDMSSALLGRAPVRQRALFWEYGRDSTYLRPARELDQSPNLAMRDGRWKMLINADGTRPELYDLAGSPREQTNLAVENKEVARRFSERLLGWWKRVAA